MAFAGRTFKKKPPAGGAERTFVSFILEPLYKIYSQVRSADLPPGKQPSQHPDIGLLALLVLSLCEQQASASDELCN